MNRRKFLRGMLAAAAITAAGPIAARRLALAEDPDAFQLTRENVIDWIKEVGTVLDEQDVPRTDRWLLVPSKVVELIRRSDLNDATIAGDALSYCADNRVGIIDDFALYAGDKPALRSGADDQCLTHEDLDLDLMERGRRYLAKFKYWGPTVNVMTFVPGMRMQFEAPDPSKYKRPPMRPH